jgi:hypothetical protein
MDQAAAQKRVRQLVEMALRAPDSQEGRTAAIAAWKLVRDQGLLIVRTEELVSFTIAASPPPADARSVTNPAAPAKKKRSKKKPVEIVAEVTQGVVTTLDAATTIASSLNGLRKAVQGR